MSHIIRNMFSMRTTQPDHNSHVAPPGLGGMGIRHCYKHAAPLGLKAALTAEWGDQPGRKRGRGMDASSYASRFTHYAPFV